MTETVLPEAHRFEMVRYLRNHQNGDGGVGLHIEGHSTMFGTSLNYVAARLLGVAADDTYCVRARAFMHARGGAVNNTSWAKFWLCLLGVYEWRGINPLPPEMWLLPYWLIVHPGRFWCRAESRRGAPTWGRPARAAPASATSEGLARQRWRGRRGSMALSSRALVASAPLAARSAPCSGAPPAEPRPSTRVRDRPRLPGLVSLAGLIRCHCRMVYLPMSYLYGKRAACPPTPLTTALRSELFVEPYEAVAWETHRNHCGPEDMYTSHSVLQVAPGETSALGPL